MSIDPTIRPNSENSRSNRTSMSDEQLMAEIQCGSGDAFAVLFDRYQRLVLVTALKIVRDIAEAEEVTQSVFLEIYRSATQFDPARGNLRVWLLQFAYHRSINRRNYLALRQFYDRGDIHDAVEWEISGAPSPKAPQQELARFAEQALAMLNEPQRKAIQMVFFEGMTLREVAECTGESLSNVRNHYYRGLDRLRSGLSHRSRQTSDHRVIGIGEVDRAEA